MNTDEHKCAPAVSAQPPATCRHAARLGAQQGRRQPQQAGSCQPAGTSVLLFLICSAGLKAQTNAWITQRTTDQTPQSSPSFLLSLFQCRFCMLNKRRQRARLHLGATGQHCPGMELDIYLFALRGLCPLSHRHKSQGITEPSHLNLLDGFSQVWHCTKSLLHKFHKTTCAQKGETRVLNIHTLAPITFDLTFSFYVVQAVADLHHHLTTKS